MQHNTISPLIMQNRLLSQARSGARAQSAAIGSAIQRTNSKNSGDSDSVKNDRETKKNNKLLEESRENFTALKKAAEEVRERSKKLQDILEKDIENMTEEEAAKYRASVEEKITDFVNGYNSLIRSLNKESSGANGTYLKQLKEYFGRSSKLLGEMGIKADSEGILSVDKELLAAADLTDLKTAFAGKSSFAGKISARAEDIIANAQTNLGILNKSLNAGNYTYNRTSSAIYDILNGNGKYDVIS